MRADDWFTKQKFMQCGKRHALTSQKNCLFGGTNKLWPFYCPIQTAKFNVQHIVVKRHVVTDAAGGAFNHRLYAISDETEGRCISHLGCVNACDVRDLFRDALG